MRREFRANSVSPKTLETEPVLTPRVVETLLWVARRKPKPEIATILGISEARVKKHVLEVFNTVGVETCTSAGLRALEVLSSPAVQG